MKTPVVSRNPEVLGGTPVFVGTRVPIQNLIDCLAGGYSIDEFLDDFPSVTREQVIAFLEQAKDVAAYSTLLAVTIHDSLTSHAPISAAGRIVPGR